MKNGCTISIPLEEKNKFISFCDVNKIYWHDGLTLSDSFEVSMKAKDYKAVETSCSINYAVKTANTMRGECMTVLNDSKGFLHKRNPILVEGRTVRRCRQGWELL